MYWIISDNGIIYQEKWLPDREIKLPSDVWFVVHGKLALTSSMWAGWAGSFLDVSGKDSLVLLMSQLSKGLKIYLQ